MSFNLPCTSFTRSITEVREVLGQLDEEDDNSIKSNKNLVQSNAIPIHLSFTKSNLSFLPATIKKLEENGLSLTSVIDLVNEVQGKLKDIPRKRGVSLRDKFQSVLACYPGFEVMVSVNASRLGLCSTESNSSPSTPTPTLPFPLVP